MPPHHLATLQIESVRNLDGVDLQLAPTGNFFLGLNGAGKTSVLEAVHFLSTGRSFRTHHARTLISHSAELCRVVGRVDAAGLRTTLGLQRGRDGSLTARVGGENASSLSELAAQLPVVLLDTESLSLLTGGPEGRRRFLDGTVFHVEQAFLPIWRRYQRALRQRNAGLRHVTMSADPAWRDELAQSGEALTHHRSLILEALGRTASQIAATMSPELQDVRLQLRQGWDANLSLSDALEQGVESDKRQGFTQTGPHRADVKVSVNGKPAAEVLSRGQLKVLVSALRLAQGQAVSERGDIQPVYLIDDLLAELDVVHAQNICSKLAGSGAQVLMTAVDQGSLLDWWGNTPFKVFHVEHGQVSLASS